MQRTKVSYLIALYNKEDFIEECIDSILKESNKAIEIEVCIVDDGSTDRSLEIVQSKYYMNPQIKISSFNKNRGKCAAYNKAYSMSTGDYICIFGADDIIIPNRTLKLLNQVKKFDKSTYGKSIKYFNNIEKLSDTIDKVNNLTYKRTCRDIRFKDIVMQNCLGGGSSMLKKEHAKQVFPVPEHLKFEDWWISYHLVRNEWVVATNELVSIYRIHDNNDCASTGSKYDKIKRDYLRHFDYLASFKETSKTDYERKLIDKSIAIREAFFKDYKLSHIKQISLDKYSLRIILFYVPGGKKVCEIKEKLDTIIKL